MSKPFKAIGLMLILGTLLSTSGCSRSGARTTAATETIKGQYITQLVDAGNTTPEAALESSFWCIAKGDYDAIIDSYVPQMRKVVEGWYAADKADSMSRVKAKFESFKGLQIVARKVIAEDKVELRYYNEFKNQGPEKRTDQIMLQVKIGNAWKSSQKRPYTSDWDDGSQPEPQT